MQKFTNLKIIKLFLRLLPLLVTYILFSYYISPSKDLFFSLVEIICGAIGISIVLISRSHEEYESFYKNFGLTFLPLSIIIFLKIIIVNSLLEDVGIGIISYLDYCIHYMEFVVIGIALILTFIGRNRIISITCYVFTTLIVTLFIYFIFKKNIFNLSIDNLYICKITFILTIFIILILVCIFDKKILSKEGKEHISIYLILILIYQMLLLIGTKHEYNFNIVVGIIRYIAYFVIYDGISEFMFFKDYDEMKNELEQIHSEQKKLNHILNNRNKALKEIKLSIGKSEKKYGELIESIKDGMIIFYFNRLYYINGEALKILNIDNYRAVIGRNFEYVMRRISPDNNLEKEFYYSLEYKENKNIKNKKLFKVNKLKKEDKEYEVSLLKIDNLSRLVYIKDVTEINKNMRVRMEYEEYLKEEILKNEFYSNISHELRTPINLIYSALQLNEYYLNNHNILATKKNNQAIKQNCLRLIRTINNFIDTNKISEGYFNIDIRTYNIVSLVESITLACTSWTDKIHNTLIFDATEEEIPVRCDKDAIERIMLNLLSNSVKYGVENGEIEVLVEGKEDDIYIHVMNKGYTISEDILPYIFDRFTKLNKSLNREKEGSGLGLFLCKALIELQGGSIKVECNDEVGTDFIIKLTRAYHDEEVEEDELFNIDIMNEKVETEFSDIYL